MPNHRFAMGYVKASENSFIGEFQALRDLLTGDNNMGL